jgi:hypothetical protein
MALVFGTIVVGCDNGSTDDGNASNGNGGTDPALNGTWVDETGYVLKFNKGSFEGLLADGTIYEKGTYTTNGGSIIMQRTQLANGNWAWFLDNEEELILEQKLYTKDQIKTAVEKRLKEMGLTDAEFSAECKKIFYYIEQVFLPSLGTYSVEGNTLGLKRDIGSGLFFILTRK